MVPPGQCRDKQMCSLPSGQLESLLTRFLEYPLISDNAQPALASWQQERKYSVESLTSDMVERCMQEQLVASGDPYIDNPIAERRDGSTPRRAL